MRVQFVEQYDYRPSGDPRITVRYLSGGGPAKDGVYTVKRECGRNAVTAGKAKVVRAPRGEANV